MVSTLVSDSEATELLDSVELAKDGDVDALRRIFEANAPALLGRIRTMMGPSARRFAESGDFVQEVFVEVLDHLDQFEPRGERAFLRWTTRIARNKIHDSLRKKREDAISRLLFSSFAALHAEVATPSMDAAERESVDELVDALEQLPEDRRRVIELRDFEGRSFARIGEELGRSENAVQLLHTRAVVQLGGLLRRSLERRTSP